MTLLKTRFRFLVVMAPLTLAAGCIEEFTPETGEFIDLLVVEATITDEIKHQKIYLNRTYTFEDNTPIPEIGAQVKVLDDSDKEHLFQESEPGVYISSNPFRAEPGLKYSLKIETKSGADFTSDQQELPEGSVLDSLYAERITKDSGEEGIGIFIDNSNNQRNSRDFRYDYVETYKIVAPDWNSVALINVPDIICPRTIKAGREQEERTCYATKNSTEIILASTESFDENRIERFLVRFVDRSNYIISHRYSILVRQYVESNASFSFYKALNEFSSSESIFSETQPGFLEGNVYSDTDADQKVLGYFDVSKVSEKRIFFNYEDFFPNKELPPYVDPCQRAAPKVAEGHGSDPRCILSTLVDLNLIRYVTDNPSYTGPQSDGGPFLTVPRVCGDCTVLGSTTVPEFWIE